MLAMSRQRDRHLKPASHAFIISRRRIANLQIQGSSWYETSLFQYRLSGL